MVQNLAACPYPLPAREEYKSWTGGFNRVTAGQALSGGQIRTPRGDSRALELSTVGNLKLTFNFNPPSVDPQISCPSRRFATTWDSRRDIHVCLNAPFSSDELRSQVRCDPLTKKLFRCGLLWNTTGQVGILMVRRYYPQQQ